jgi:hypothetical protein
MPQRKPPQYALRQDFQLGLGAGGGIGAVEVVVLRGHEVFIVSAFQNRLKNVPHVRNTPYSKQAFFSTGRQARTLLTGLPKWRPAFPSSPRFSTELDRPFPACPRDEHQIVDYPLSYGFVKDLVRNSRKRR